MRTFNAGATALKNVMEADMTKLSLEGGYISSDNAGFYEKIISKYFIFKNSRKRYPRLIFFRLKVPGKAVNNINILKTTPSSRGRCSTHIIYGSHSGEKEGKALNFPFNRPQYENRGITLFVSPDITGNSFDIVSVFPKFASGKHSDLPIRTSSMEVSGISGLVGFFRKSLVLNSISIYPQFTALEPGSGMLHATYMKGNIWNMPRHLKNVIIEKDMFRMFFNSMPEKRWALETETTNTFPAIFGEAKNKSRTENASVQQEDNTKSGDAISGNTTNETAISGNTTNETAISRNAINETAISGNAKHVDRIVNLLDVQGSYLSRFMRSNIEDEGYFRKRPFMWPYLFRTVISNTEAASFPVKRWTDGKPPGLQARKTDVDTSSEIFSPERHIRLVYSTFRNEDASAGRAGVGNEIATPGGSSGPGQAGVSGPSLNESPGYIEKNRSRSVLKKNSSSRPEPDFSAAMNPGDINIIVNRVYGLLESKLLIEKERRGR